MDEKTQSPRIDCDDHPGSKNNAQRNHSTSERPLKWRRVLAALYAGRSFNRFDAVRELRDWCLHSTVSGLQARGLTIHRSDETVPGFQNIPTHVCRYKLAPESYAKARELLGLPAAAPGEHATAEGLAS